MFLYRAKVKDRDTLVIGYYFKTSKAHYIHPIGPNFGYVEIEYDTLAVHHPQMMAGDSLRLLPDGSKDLRIFLALVKTGGDMLTTDLTGQKVTQYMYESVEPIPYFMEWEDFIIMGIHNVS